MSIFPSNSELGNLKIVEVYDYYDGPKFFCTINQFKQLMVVYWADYNKEDKSNGWLYLPITDEKLNELRRGKVSVRNAFESPEQGLYLVYTYPDSSNDSTEYIKKGKTSKAILPPKTLKILPENIDVIDKVETNWVYELRIKKPNSHDLPSTTAVTSTLNTFRDIIESLMTTNSREQPKISPLSAVYGSFKLKLAASDNEKAIKALNQFEKIITSNNKNLLTLLKESKLDPFILKSIYEVILNNNVEITVTPKTFEKVKKPIKLNKKNISSKISILEKTTFNIVESIKVPQANDINKVIEILELKREGKKITHDLIDGLNSPRQIKYYIDAAFSLDLLTREGHLTASGRYLLSKTTEDNRYEVLADRFESSDFGWAWMNWSKVQSMNDLKAETASDFIQACVPGLGTDTAKRRATTLIQWLRVLKPYNRKYSE